MQNETHNVLVLGATGGSGRAAVAELLARGHRVTAFARRALDMEHERLRVVQGDALVASDYAAVQGFVLAMALLFVALNLIIDLLYAVIDPRIGFGAT